MLFLHKCAALALFLFALYALSIISLLLPLLASAWTGFVALVQWGIERGGDGVVPVDASAAAGLVQSLDEHARVTHPDDPMPEQSVRDLINFRDFGGFVTSDGQHVRRGVLFRSAALGHASEADLAQLSRAGIAVVVDLRNPHEHKKIPTVALPHGARKVELAVQSKGQSGSDIAKQIAGMLWMMLFARRGLSDVGPAYVTFLEAREAWAEVFEEIAKAFTCVEGGGVRRAAVLIHCTSGKDRTGLAAALLLRLLGVPERAVVAEYTQTNAHFQRIFDDFAAHSSMAGIGVPDAHITPGLTARAAFMEHALAHIDRTYGGVEQFLAGGGLSSEALRTLRSALLCPCSADQ